MPPIVMIGFAETDLASLYQQLGATAQSQDMQARAEAFWGKHPYLLGQLAHHDPEGETAGAMRRVIRAHSALIRELCS